MRPATANKRGCNNAVREHLQYPHRRRRARWPQQNRVARTHVAHARITDDKFQITLAKRHLPRHTRFRSLPAQQSICSTSEIPAEKDSSRRADRLRAELHHNSSEQHRTRSRSSDMTSRRPGMQWPDAGPAQQSRETTTETPTTAIAVKFELRELVQVQ